jgi:hypothetical protein
VVLINSTHCHSRWMMDIIKRTFVDILKPGNRYYLCVIVYVNLSADLHREVCSDDGRPSLGDLLRRCLVRGFTWVSSSCPLVLEQYTDTGHCHPPLNSRLLVFTSTALVPAAKLQDRGRQKRLNFSEPPQFLQHRYQNINLTVLPLPEMP